MTYRDYTIKAVEHQGCRNYIVISPSGTRWQEVAATIKTAKKWIDSEWRCPAKPETTGYGKAVSELADVVLTAVEQGSDIESACRIALDDFGDQVRDEVMTKHTKALHAS